MLMMIFVRGLEITLQYAVQLARLATLMDGMVTLTNTLYTDTVPPGMPTILPRPPDTPLAVAVATVSPMHQ